MYRFLLQFSHCKSDHFIVWRIFKSVYVQGLVNGVLTWAVFRHINIDADIPIIPLTHFNIHPAIIIWISVWYFISAHMYNFLYCQNSIYVRNMNLFFSCRISLGKKRGYICVHLAEIFCLSSERVFIQQQ
jgi:hypothetical protein